MRDGSIVRFDGDLFKKIEGNWVLLEPNPEVWYPDVWMESRKYDRIFVAGPLNTLKAGSVVAGVDGSVVAVAQGDDMWTLSGEEDWSTTDEMLAYIGEDWKIIYKAGENNE